MCFVRGGWNWALLQALLLSRDGSTLWSAAADKTIIQWDVHTLTVVRTLKGHTGGALHPRPIFLALVTTCSHRVGQTTNRSAILAAHRAVWSSANDALASAQLHAFCDDGATRWCNHWLSLIPAGPTRTFDRTSCVRLLFAIRLLITPPRARCAQ
jgi:hypothetical protein